ncbi:MAG: hypothetical protein ACXWP4_26435, partial [Polyangiales bacterium]
MTPDRGAERRGERPAETSEVKGLWFVTARRFTVQQFGDVGLRAVLAELPPEVRPSLGEPLPSHWYPESHLQTCLDVTRRMLAGDDPDRMQKLLEGCTKVGINAFWRVALQVTAPQFALRALPVSWRHMRRGPGYMRVEIEGSIGRVHYGDFPYFDDSNYRLL